MGSVLNRMAATVLAPLSVLPHASSNAPVRGLRDGDDAATSLEGLPSNCVATVFAIPELMAHILSFLPPSDLVPTRGVSRLFRMSVDNLARRFLFEEAWIARCVESANLRSGELPNGNRSLSLLRTAVDVFSLRDLSSGFTAVLSHCGIREESVHFSAFTTLNAYLKSDAFCSDFFNVNRRLPNFIPALERMVSRALCASDFHGRLMSCLQLVFPVATIHASVALTDNLRSCLVVFMSVPTGLLSRMQFRLVSVSYPADFSQFNYVALLRSTHYLKDYGVIRYANGSVFVGETKSGCIRAPNGDQFQSDTPSFGDLTIGDVTEMGNFYPMPAHPYGVICMGPGIPMENW
ncbi:MAG: F-box protein [bacterium]|nr:F-box protein [bacterium]